MFIGPADDLEEQFGSCLGEGNVSKFINHQEMESLESRVRNETRMLGSERGYGRPVVERPYGAYSPLYAARKVEIQGGLTGRNFSETLTDKVWYVRNNFNSVIKESGYAQDHLPRSRFKDRDKASGPLSLPAGSSGPNLFWLRDLPVDVFSSEYRRL
jgi:hypothetical protein